MAISGFGRGKSGSGTAATSAPASSGSGGFGNLTAFIDQGSEFEGKLSFKDTVRIDGTFSGEISSDNTLIVGETGEIHATITSVSVVISGRVEGDVMASQQVVLHKTAVVNGDIESPSFIVEEGAQLNGTVRMTTGRSATTGSASSPDPSKNGKDKGTGSTPDGGSNA